MLRLQLDRRCNVLHRHLERLAGQREHDVDIDIVKAGRLRVRNGLRYFRWPVNTSQALQGARIETLCADGKSIHARLPIAIEIVVLDRARVRLHRDFDIGRQRQMLGDTVEDCADFGATEKTWCTAANEHTADCPPICANSLKLDVLYKRADVSITRRRITGFVRIEIAVRTLANAPR